MPSTKLARYLRKTKTRPAEFARRAGMSRMVLHHYLVEDRRPGVRYALAIEAASGGAIPASYWATAKIRKQSPAARRALRSA